MKKTFLSLTALMAMVLVGCEQPRQTRGHQRGTASSEPLQFTSSSSSSSGGTYPSNPTPPPTPAGGLVIPTEISHCSWASDGMSGFASSHAHIGEYTLCKSVADETDIYLQVKNNVSDSQLCLFPTTAEGSASTYIGEARCLMVTDNKKIYKIKMYKNRPGFESKSITGIMLMKDKAYFYPAPFYQYVLSPDAYLYCSNWLAIYKDQSYCVAFKSVGQYIYHQF
ncbi:MAG: hypothetical protein Fur0010_03310 [Bdellovibrio sp.]